MNPPDDKPAFTPDELQVARDEIIECVLAFGQWPQPRGRLTMILVEKEFDLYDFLRERTALLITTQDLLEFLILAMSDHGICGAFAAKRDAWEKKITEWLIAFFTDTERGWHMVEESCEEIARQEREDH